MARTRHPSLPKYMFELTALSSLPGVLYYVLLIGGYLMDSFDLSSIDSLAAWKVFPS
jgi:hypothetical protein